MVAAVGLGIAAWSFYQTRAKEQELEAQSIFTAKQSRATKQSLLNMPPNTPTEFYHGTSLEAALAIQSDGFDVGRSGSNAGGPVGFT